MLTRLPHRRDIDGLRALAVLLIVTYHAGLPFLPGGYVGVDVFFVISGYLITTQLVASPQHGWRLALEEFYARRARRIIPALAVVTVTTLVLGHFLLLPSRERQDLAWSAIASSLLVSNVHFMRVAGDYFAGPSELRPLLHTWSLSVEEQLYLVWPLLLLSLGALARRMSGESRRRVLLAGVGVATAASLLASAYWTHESPDAAFFLAPSRMWEFGMGALVSLSAYRRAPSSIPRGALALVGILVIVSSSVAYSAATPFPGVAALAPVLGTCLLLVAGEQGTSGAVALLLSTRPLRAIADSSYSWYLWHWPLLAIVRTIDPERRDLTRDIALVVAALGLAMLTTRWVEDPIRRQRVRAVRGDARSLLAAAAALLVVLGVAGLEGMSAHRDFDDQLAPASVECMDVGTLSRTGPCLLANGSAGTIYLVGDSHADMWSPPVGEWARASKFLALERSWSACPTLVWAYPDDNPLWTTASASIPACISFARRVMDEVHASASSDRPTTLIIALRWAGYVNFPDSGLLAPTFARALDSLEAWEVPVIVIGPSLEFARSVPGCVARRSAEECRITRRAVTAANAPINAMLLKLTAAHANTSFWSPTDALCGPVWCDASRESVSLFRDRHHLSRAGALAAGRGLADRMDALPKRGPTIPRQSPTAATAP